MAGGQKERRPNRLNGAFCPARGTCALTCAPGPTILPFPWRALHHGHWRLWRPTMPCARLCRRPQSSALPFLTGAFAVLMRRACRSKRGRWRRSRVRRRSGFLRAVTVPWIVAMNMSEPESNHLRRRRRMVAYFRVLETFPAGSVRGLLATPICVLSVRVRPGVPIAPCVRRGP